MTRQELAAYLTETYNTTGEHLFTRYPNFLVFHHSGKKKWFAVLMDISRKNLDLTDESEISVVNLKCDTTPYDMERSAEEYRSVHNYENELRRLLKISEDQG